MKSRESEKSLYGRQWSYESVSAGAVEYSGSRSLYLDPGMLKEWLKGKRCNAEKGDALESVLEGIRKLEGDAREERIHVCLKEIASLEEGDCQVWFSRTGIRNAFRTDLESVIRRCNGAVEPALRSWDRKFSDENGSRWEIDEGMWNEIIDGLCWDVNGVKK